jgi:hypothetical protein
MAFTMMAGAAYTDQADITATEAVDTLAALNIMTGDTNGSFRPNDTVTRAEMCRMIYSIRNQGKSDASAYAKMKTTFTDVPESAWYAGYVKYCQSVGIVSGRSDKIFDPNAKVTGVEAALMCLRVMGYDPAKAGIGGSTWSMTTIGLADENGLLDDVNCPMTTGLPRQYAAQIMYNMIDAETVRWSTDSDSYNNYSDNGTKYETVGKKYMDLNKVVATMTDFSKTSGKDTYEARLDKATIDKDESDSEVVNFSKIAKDYSALKYKKVKVLFKKADEVYGIFATTDNTQKGGLLSGLKMDGNKAKLDGTKYDLAEDTTVYVNGDLLYVKTKDSNGKVTAFTTNAAEALKQDDKKVTAEIADWINTYGDDAAQKYENNQFWQGTEVELLATDGSTNFSILKVETAAIGKVTAVGSDYINVTVKGGDKTITTKTKLENDDWNYSSDLKKDDYVVITAAGNYADGDGRVEKAEVVSGKVTSTKSDDGVAIGGEWYTMAGKGSFMVKRPSTGSNVDMVVVNGYVYFTDTTAGSVEDVALLVEAAPSGGTGSKWEARMIFADGTDKVVEIEKYWEDEDNNDEIAKMTEANDTPILVTYEKSGDKYTLTKIGANHTYDDTDFETAGYDAYVSGKNMWTDGSLKESASVSSFEMTAKDQNGNTISGLNRLYYESAGVVFVEYKTKDNGESSYKVVSGKVAQDYDKKVLNMAAVADKDGSGYYAQAAFINLGEASTGGSSDNYAVVLGDVVKDTTNGTVYKITAWNGTEEIEITTDDSAAKNMNKGDIFSWTGSKEAADIDVPSSSATGDFYVGAYDEGSGDITLYKDAKPSGATVAGSGDKYNKVDAKDTVVLYVNSDDGAGVESGEIELAYYYDSDFWSEGKIGSGTLTEDNAPNVTAYFDDDDYITVLVVDVNRNITQW